jgi:hypothetical protein
MFSVGDDDFDLDLDGDDDYSGSGLLGYDDLDGDFALSGAAPKKVAVTRQLQAAKLKQQANILAKKRALQQKSMQSLQPTQQTQVLPFPTAAGGGATVAAGATNTVFANPQRPFQTQRFVWGSSTSAFFRILQLTIGQENMFVQAGSVPAEIFSQTGVGVALCGYIAYPGIDITLQVTNGDTDPHPIDASIIGSSLV